MAKKPSRPPIGTKGAAEYYWKRYTELYPKYFWADDTKLADIVVASAKGSLLYDVEGKEYIDLTSQWATNNLGNVHPEFHGPVPRPEHRRDGVRHTCLEDASELGGVLRRGGPRALPDDVPQASRHDRCGVRRLVPRLHRGPDPPARRLPGSDRGGDLRADRPGGGRLDPPEEFRAGTSQDRGRARLVLHRGRGGGRPRSHREDVGD